MHELGILSSMLKTLENIMEEENLTHIDKIVLQVGEISGIVPDYLEYCFPAAVYKTKFEDMKMEMEIIPGYVKCGYCSEEFNALKNDRKCPKCGATDNMSPIMGQDFLIKEIQAY